MGALGYAPLPERKKILNKKWLILNQKYPHGSGTSRLRRLPPL